MSPIRLTSILVALTAAAGCGDNASTPGPDAGGEVCAPSEASVSVDELAAASWDPRFTIAGLTGLDGHAPTLYDFARDVDGSIVAAGEFRWMGGARVEPLVRLRAGAWEPARTTWELTPPGSGFSAIAIAANGDLALATYDDFGERDGEIWLDDGSGLRVIGTYEGLIRSLAWYDGALWAAGWNILDDGAGGVIQGLAVWDGATWAPPPGGAIDGFAFELTLDAGALLVGGYFSEIGGIDADAVASWDGVAWRALDLPGGVGVYALARGADDELYAGGALGDLGGGTGGIVRWTGTAWTPVGGGVANHAWPGVVTDIVDHAGALYLAGCFVTAGGGEGDPAAVTSRDVVRWDGAWHALDDDTGAVFGPWLEPRACGDEGPASVWDVSKQRLVSTDAGVLLAGSFPGIAGTQSQALIAHDGGGWVAQGAGGLGLGGGLDRIGAAGASCSVYGMGFLSHAAGTPTRARVVHFDGTTWTPVADSIPADAYCPAFAVSPDGAVAVGCMEFPAEGDAIGRVYRLAGAELTAIAGELPPVQALAYDATGRLWIGGGGATGFLARLAGDELAMIETGFDGALNQIDPDTGDAVIVAGWFANVGDVPAARIARFDGASWTALGDGMPAMVTALAHDATTVYASTYDEGAGAYLLGAWDGVAWRELAGPAAGLTVRPYFNFNAIRIIDGAVIAAGTAELDDGTGRGALVYRDGAFSPLAGGVHAVTVGDLAITGDAIWVAGQIAEAGAGPGMVPTVGVARLVLAP